MQIALDLQGALFFTFCVVSPALQLGHHAQGGGQPMLSHPGSLKPTRAWKQSLCKTTSGGVEHQLLTAAWRWLCSWAASRCKSPALLQPWGSAGTAQGLGGSFRGELAPAHGCPAPTVLPQLLTLGHFTFPWAEHQAWGLLPDEQICLQSSGSCHKAQLNSLGFVVRRLGSNAEFRLGDRELQTAPWSQWEYLQCL